MGYVAGFMGSNPEATPEVMMNTNNTEPSEKPQFVKLR